ncbi:HPP family protein [Verrucomicrobium sp. BvORR106]|uniref:HPP family protein n=1 Tax=Verrucomicrobium sp. BvORR106 TaxID=1403819 RepID=UPI0007C66327|nr:HPP family protein [Verrucomicrobium sp. BvORR106]
MSSFKAFLGVELNPVSPREKAVSATGGFISIILLLIITESTLHLSGAAAVIASMGASAVLLFAVPHGSLSQPWPVIAGHGFSAFFGVLCARSIPNHYAAAAAAVALAILAMHVFKCIHPPGGATALTAVLGGPAVQALGYKFVFFPVLANAVTMVMIAILFNALFAWRRYPALFNRPAVAMPAPTTLLRDDTAILTAAPTHEQIVQALRSLDSFVDITEEDLIRLVQILRQDMSPELMATVSAQSSDVNLGSMRRMRG